MNTPCSRHTRQQSLAAAKSNSTTGKDTPITSKGKTGKKPIKPKKPAVRTDSPYFPRKLKTEIPKIKSEPISPIKAENSLKLSISKTEIEIENESISNGNALLNDDAPLSALEVLFNTSESSDKSEQSDILNDMELTSDEIGEVSLPVLSIPNDVRSEAGPNWRMKEALLNSYHFGKTTIKATDFARSQSEIKTAEILADKTHSLASKKYFVKIHIGRVLS